MNSNKYLNGQYQEAVCAFVDREVIYCVSRLVSEVAKQDEDYWHLFRAFDPDRARELVREAIDEDGDNQEQIEDLDLEDIRDLKEAIDNLCLDYTDAENEVYEHWLVSEWLAAKLEEKGEAIERDFYGLTIWGRCGTGQAILLDRVICDIYDETYGEGGAQ